MLISKSEIPLISVIVPCYNHGKYIDEALYSIEASECDYAYEIIIIDDGSTDEGTINRLKELDKLQKYTIILQKNQKVSAARNNAIAVAKGKYILPVDADNRIRKDFIQKATLVLENNNIIDIVYSHGMLFGEEEGIKYQRSFNLQALMLDNYIDTCALFKKEVWENVEGYDESMKNGYEDWEFWLHAAFKGFNFYHIDEILFDYRMLSTSRNNRVKADKSKTNAIMDYMMKKHSTYYSPELIDETLIIRYKHNPVAFVYKFFLRLYFPNKYKRLVESGKLRKYIV